MRCPVCRADDNHTSQCRRCKANLELLARIERERAAVLDAARSHAGRGEATACLAAAQRSHLLRADRDSLQWIAVGSLLNADFAAAWRAYQKRGRAPY
jgi:hypothetical protein